MRHTIKFIILFSFIFSVTNFIPVSVLVVSLVPLGFIGIFYKDNFLKKKRIELYILLLFCYIIMSTLYYDPASFLDFDFYRRDGNFFISYLVLFVFVFMPIGFNINIDSAIKYAFTLFFVVSLFAYAFIPPEEGGVQHFLFVSHNAAGGFYSVVCAIAVGLYLSRRSLIYLFYALAFFFFLYASNSRGSILAILCAVGYGLFRFKRPGLVLSIFILFQFIIVLDTYPIWVSTGKVMSENANFTISQNVDFQRAGTFIDRLYYLWPRAFDNFIHSPIFGIGFGSFDDLYYKYIDVVPYLFTIKDGAVLRHTDAHAHNSTFTILAELGIVGYILFILLFAQINKKISGMKEYDEGLSIALNLAFWTCIFSSATEHRITTPTQMIPFFIVFGIAYVKYYGKTK
ncbi:O-antigen polymerase [Serratia fonticola AU-P3(3)]|nr:O-antigen polymerase [Serratia fonticola AU-P3(3)]